MKCGQLLFSIGRQTGITIESLCKISSELVAGKELLQSVFNGITDMVVLLDRGYDGSTMVNQGPPTDYFNMFGGRATC